MGLNGVDKISVATVQDERKKLTVEKGKVTSIPLGGNRVTVETNNNVSEMYSVTSNPYEHKGYEKSRMKELQNLFRMSGKSDKEAKELAKAYVKNEKNKYEFYTTETYDNKKDYKRAKKEIKADKKSLVAQFRHEGMSKREAKEAADSVLPKVKLLKNKAALKILKNNKDVFYDENGNISQEKIKMFVKSLMNPGTNEKEVDNYHMSLKESRLMAQVLGCDDKTLRKIVKSTGGNFEKDYSTLIKLATTAVTAGLAALAGLPFDATSTSVSKSGAESFAQAGTETAGGQAGAVAGAIAGAKASVNGSAIAAPLGAALGAILAGKDNGGTEDRVYAPVEDTPTPTIVTPPEEKECDLVPKEVSIPVSMEEETCDVKLNRKTSLYDAVRDGYNLKNHKEIMKFVHAIKDRYGYKYTDAVAQADWKVPVELFGKKFNCGGKVRGTRTDDPKEKPKGTPVARKSYNPQMINDNVDKYYYEDCNGYKSKYFDTAVERDDAMKKRQAELK